MQQKVGSVFKCLENIWNSVFVSLSLSISVESEGNIYFPENGVTELSVCYVCIVWILNHAITLIILTVLVLIS